MNISIQLHISSNAKLLKYAENEFVFTLYPCCFSRMRIEIDLCSNTAWTNKGAFFFVVCNRVG